MKIQLSIILFLICALSSNAQKINHKLASVYVYNFAKEINFPSDVKTDKFKIGIFKDKDIYEAFKNLENKAISDQKIEVLLIENKQDIEKCHIIYIGEDLVGNIVSISEIVKQKHILIISEGRGNSKKGADISLFIDDNDNFKTKFELNIKEAEKRKLRFPNSLLSYASK